MKYLFSLIVLIGAALSVWIAGNDSNLAHAQAICNNDDFYISQPLGGVVAPVQTVKLIVDGDVNDDISKVTFVSNSIANFAVMGNAKKSTSGGSGENWTMLWDTKFSPASPYELRALVNFDGGGSCFTDPVFITDNFTVVPAPYTLTPSQWTGPTNITTTFTLSPTGPYAAAASAIAEYIVVEWSVQGVGSITQPTTTSARFSSPAAGTSIIKAVIRYGSIVKNVSIPVTVNSQYTSPESGDSGSGSDSTQSGSGEQSGSQSSPVVLRDPIVQPSEAFSQVIDSSNELKTCFNGQLGDDTVRSLLQENRRPSSSEFKRYLGCFKDQNYIIPNILAPVAPEDVVKTRETKAVKIAKIFNRKITTEDNSEKTTLVLSGQAAENTDVLVYIFSEPLVLVASSDDEGLWEYTLEDPLPSGEHEVYALVDRGDGEYERSSFASFFVGTAEATEANPNGYSLDLVAEPTISPSTRKVDVFIAATIGLTVFALTAFSGFIVYRLRNQKSEPKPQGAENIVPPDNDVSGDTTA